MIRVILAIGNMPTDEVEGSHGFEAGKGTFGEGNAETSKGEKRKKSRRDGGDGWWQRVGEWRSCVGACSFIGSW